MKKKFLASSMKKNRKGFSLIELLVTIAILGVLASIAVPAYTGYKRGAARQEATANLQSLSLCLEQHYSEANSYLKSGDSVPKTYSWLNNGATDEFSSWLPCFQPRKSSGSQTLKYNYVLTVSATNAFVINATGVLAPVASDLLSLNQNGTKTGAWPN